jgi:hypothetical protein
VDGSIACGPEVRQSIKAPGECGREGSLPYSIRKEREKEIKKGKEIRRWLS